MKRSASEHELNFGIVYYTMRVGGNKAIFGAENVLFSRSGGCGWYYRQGGVGGGTPRPLLELVYAFAGRIDWDFDSFDTTRAENRKQYKGECDTLE
jgi:hypothetical protein